MILRSSMGDGRPCSPSLWDDVSSTGFHSPPVQSHFVARNLTFTREEIVGSQVKLTEPSIGLPSNYRSDRSRRTRVVRKFPLSVVVKRQCAVPLQPPSLFPASAGSGNWSQAKVVLHISESEGEQHVETDAWAFNEHQLHPDEDMMGEERHPHLMESSEDPPLFSSTDLHDNEWPWVKEERSPSPEPCDIIPEDLQCPIDDLEPTDCFPSHHTEVHEEEDTPLKEVVERSLVFHGEELARPSHSPVTGFPCPERNCQSVLSSLTALRKHKLVHAPKIYGCTQCDRSFAERTKLTRHERSHTGEKPYKCVFPGCEKVFAHSFNLTTHMKLHSDERPFVCQICGRSFAKNSNLRVHAVTHSRPKLTRKTPTRRHH
ncbi:hypothetical protein PFISCL1PPCAC_318 [Pristionchus fissidentatus]|uniref:C2H2-type domain-containing protein n=1 Tax=Pristionchus fissidentatus TaxID=1538716 RepID=A0AAV5URC8_9BILA|nr:hypothetical protein PFISCL1PPCAC_318 [Pristionchus fissidentatus]